MKSFSIGKSRPSKAGLSPGTLIFSGERRMERTSLRCMSYNQDVLEEMSGTLEELAPLLDRPGHVTWLDLSGIHDADVIKAIGDRFGLHPLLLEDVMNARQRPKLDTYDDYLFVVVKMLDFIAHSRDVLEEQFTMVLKPNLVITFQEQEGDIFDQVRNRLRSSKGKIRTRKADYLAYALLDAIVDEYFLILEAIGEELDGLEESMIHAGSTTELERMQVLKRQIIGIRRHVWPTREVVTAFTRLESELVSPETAIFLRDVQDHTMQVADTIESYREILGSIQDLYLSIVNNKMNEVMKVLAGISTIFLPMTLVAGIYGMNFDFMPELNQTWGYPAALGLMGMIGVGMYLYFRTRKWF